MNQNMRNITLAIKSKDKITQLFKSEYSNITNLTDESFAKSFQYWIEYQITSICSILQTNNNNIESKQIIDTINK